MFPIYIFYFQSLRTISMLMSNVTDKSIFLHFAAVFSIIVDIEINNIFSKKYRLPDMSMKITKLHFIYQLH